VWQAGRCVTGWPLWGRLATCGGLVIRLRLSLPQTHFQNVPSFHTRRLPHYHPLGQPIFITWRLHGSLPKNRSFPPSLTSGQAFVALDRLLDTARTGPFYLRQPEIAEIVVGAIRYRDEARQYRLHDYVVMPNHVHLLITPCVAVSKLLQSLKRHTAREGNRTLGLTGQPFWQDEGYDRVVRDSAEFQRIANYIIMNPVKAGITATPEEFPWSSATRSVGQVGNLRRIVNPPLTSSTPDKTTPAADPSH